MARCENLKTSGVRAKLREEIIQGYYKPGTYLPSARELARQMNISKSSIHNILKLMQDEGLIQIYPNMGALVLPSNSGGKLQRVFLRPSDYGTFNYRPIASGILLGVIRGAEKLNVEVNISLTDSGLAHEEIIAGRGNGLWQGAIYLQCAHYDELIGPLERASIPVVIAGDEHGHTKALRTYIDYRECARQAVRYLASKGHRNIGIACGSNDYFLYKESLTGFRGGMAEEGLELRPEWIWDGLKDQAKGLSGELMMKYLSRPSRPTAIYAIRDYRAEWIYKAADRLNLRIPEDISVISYGGSCWPGGYHKGLTILSEPLRQQGEEAIALLKKWIRTGERPESKCLPVALIEGTSVKTLLDDVH